LVESQLQVPPLCLVLLLYSRLIVKPYCGSPPFFQLLSSLLTHGHYLFCQPLFHSILMGKGGRLPSFVFLYRLTLQSINHLTMWRTPWEFVPGDVDNLPLQCFSDGTSPRFNCYPPLRPVSPPTQLAPHLLKRFSPFFESLGAF